MTDCCTHKGEGLARAVGDGAVRGVLVVVLLINALMFVIEFGAGLMVGSAALMADSGDMLGDALVYAISLYALGRSRRWQAGAALFKSGFILLLGLGVVLQIGSKLANGVPPSSTAMLLFGALALVANLVCLRLLWRFRADNVNMASTFECSRNDVIANTGVLIAAGGVALFDSPWPDIAVAAVIAFLFLRSAGRVALQAWLQFRTAVADAAE